MAYSIDIFNSAHIRVTSACQTTIGTFTGKYLTSTEAAVTLRSPSTVAVSASMGNQNLNLFAAGNTKCVLTLMGASRGGWRMRNKHIPPSSALATTTKNNNPATPVLELSVAELILAISPAAIEHHPVSSKDKIILSAVLPVVVIASTASFILWFRCKCRRAAQSKQDPSLISEGESGSASPL